MAAHCPICRRETVLDISLSKVSLQICSFCRTTLFPESGRVAIGRKLMPQTLGLWRKRLSELEEKSTPAEAPLCPHHSKPMEKGRVRDFAAECWSASCCDQLLLTPQQMEQFLGELEGGSSLPKKKSSSSHGWNPLFFIVRFFSRNNQELEAEEQQNRDLARAQYNNRLSAALGDVQNGELE